MSSFTGGDNHGMPRASLTASKGTKTDSRGSIAPPPTLFFWLIPFVSLGPVSSAGKAHEAVDLCSRTWPGSAGGNFGILVTLVYIDTQLCCGRDLFQREHMRH
jgi:hypothetical protein